LENKRKKNQNTRSREAALKRDKEDKEIFLAYRKGDSSGIEKLVRKHSDRIYAICCKLYARYSWSCDNIKAPEDLAQEVWIKILTAKKYEPQKNLFSSWTNTIVRNYCIDWARKNGIDTITTFIGEMGELKDVLENVPEIRPNQSENMMHRQELSRFENDRRECIKSRADELQKKMIEMFRKGKTQRQMAESFGFSLGKINKEFKKALKAVADCIKQAGWQVPVSQNIFKDLG
jgi:RNA polymerase sigma factor (sigma-70 family)